MIQKELLKKNIFYVAFWFLILDQSLKHDLSNGNSSKVIVINYWVGTILSQNHIAWLSLNFKL